MPTPLLPVGPEGNLERDYVSAAGMTKLVVVGLATLQCGYSAIFNEQPTAARWVWS